MIAVQYFASLRDARGVSREVLAFRPLSAHDLFAELAKKHRLPFTSEQLRVSVNHRFVDWNHPLADNDEVVFIPPVTGG